MLRLIRPLRPASLLPARDHHRAFADIRPDPYRWPKCAYPTPYDILELPRTAPYSRHRYVELVKLYHPDHGRHHANHSRLPTPHAKLERFRLAVAANRILSDSSRRAAYDRYGCGWPNTPVPPHHHHHHHRRHRHRSERWWQEREGHEDIFSAAYGRGGRDDASGNATWEDWERWRAARQTGEVGPQKEIWADNSVFVAIVVAFACIGSYAELSYAAGTGAQAIEQGERQTAELEKDLERRRRVSFESGEREERIRRFLVMRDPVGAGRVIGSGLDEERRKALPPPLPTRRGSEVVEEEEEGSG